MSGPDKFNENHPNQILKAISLGFDCEIDLWVVDNKLVLGHDLPQYQIDKDYLATNSKQLWIHSKNLEALLWLTSTNYVYFWHQDDDFTLTSNNYIWTYPGKELTDKSICVLPELKINDFNLIKNLPCYGICSDYVKFITNH